MYYKYIYIYISKIFLHNIFVNIVNLERELNMNINMYFKTRFYIYMYDNNVRCYNDTTWYQHLHK